MTNTTAVLYMCTTGSVSEKHLKCSALSVQNTSMSLGAHGVIRLVSEVFVQRRLVVNKTKQPALQTFCK
jgi:hypothetical protein